MKAITTAGPATGTVSAITKNIPVPSVLPTPISVSCPSPIDRRSWQSAPCAGVGEAVNVSVLTDFLWKKR